MSEFKKLEGSRVSITGEISVEQFTSFRPRAIKNIAEHIEIPGFRKGKVPENIIAQKFGEDRILHEMAELALKQSYPALLAEHNINPLGAPEIDITKITQGGPLGFVITVAIVPEVKLPDYKKIATTITSEKDMPIEITENEVLEAVETIRKQTAQRAGNPAELPEFDNEFVKTLGNYTDTTDFNTKLKEHLLREKTNRAQSKKRMKIIDSILEHTEIVVPEIVVEEELDGIIAQFKGDIAQMGAQFEDYLKHTGKTEEGIRKEFGPDAKKRSKVEFILRKIASEEKISPSHEEVEKEIEHILKHHKEADRDRARAYVTNIITNEKVLRFLENQEVEK